MASPGNEAAPPVEELLTELERERRGREEAESSRSELQSSFNRLKALAHEAIRKRDEAMRRFEEASLELAEAIRVKEEALKERDETARRLEEASRARDGLRSEIENAAHMLVTGIEKILMKVGNFKNFPGLGLPRSKKCTDLPTVAYGVIERTNEIFEELVKQIESASKSRDEFRQRMDQRKYEISIEVSQLESSISELRDEVEKKNSVIERFEKVSLVGSEALELRLNGLLIDQLSYVSKIHNQIYNVIKMVDSNDSDQSEFSESLFLPRETYVEENICACVVGMESIYDLTRIVLGKIRDLVENKGREVKYFNETVAQLVKEKEQFGSLLRGALSKRSEVFHVADNGSREAGFDFKLNKLLVDRKASASPDKEDSLGREDENDEIYNLAGALENIAKTSQLEIIDLQHSVDELRAESNSLKECVDAQARELYHRKQRIEELEDKERVANESVEGLMMDIAAAEEEILRWKVAAEEEAATGRAVEQELFSQLTAVGQELEEAKQAMAELEKKLRFKEEVATAAMAARDAAEKSLRLADIRATRLRDRLEELSRQLETREDLMSRSGRPRYACWPWQWLGIDYAGARLPDAQQRQVSNETQLSEPLL